MNGTQFGNLLTLSTFGESHGEAIGGIIGGFPSNFEVDLGAVQAALDRRKPGQSKLVTARKESDTVQFLSGIFEGKTTGAPIAFIIPNEDQKSKDYSHLENIFRPSHADFTYDKKYGNRDYRGGGRSSARETANWVVSGALASQFLQKQGIKIQAFVDQVGSVSFDSSQIKNIDFDFIEQNPVRCGNRAKASEMEELILAIKKEGDTIGGSIACWIEGVPIGLGEPIFNKLHAALGQAMLTINAAKGVEFGSGFKSVEMRGSEHNDLFQSDGSTKTNHSGGIQGGISNGMPIYFRTAFKPVASILQKQTSINSAGESIELVGKGRHDPCVVPRAVPIVEAMTALVVMDFLLVSV